MQLYSSTKACTYQGYTTNVIWSLNVFIAQDQSTSTIRPTTPPQLCFCTNFLGFNVIGWPLWFNESGSYSVPFLHFDVAFGVCHFQSYYKLQDNQVYHLFILGFIQNELFVLERTIYKCITLITSLSNLVRNFPSLDIFPVLLNGESNNKLKNAMLKKQNELSEYLLLTTLSP